MKHFREINAIALPAIVSNITTPLLGLVDMAITGHIGGAAFIGAVAIASTVFNITYWLFNFLRMGTSGPVAQAYGAGDSREIDAMLWRSLIVALVLGVVILAAGLGSSSFLIDFMDADRNSSNLALRYFSICILAAPAVMTTYALTGWLIGMQNSRIPMVVAIATDIVNIALSTALVFGFHMRLEGIAIGTLTAQYFGAAMCFIIIYRKYSPRRVELRYIFCANPLLRFFRINTDFFFRTACMVAVTLWFTHAGAKSGVDILAANALLLQLFMLFSYFMDGFAFAGEALAGKYTGRADHTALATLINSLMKTGLTFAGIFTVLYAALGREFLQILADSTEVTDTAVHFLPWAVAVPVCGFAAFLWDGIYVGLTRTRIMLASTAIAMLAFFILCMALTPAMGNNALWLAFCTYLAVRGLIEYLYYLIKKPHEK